MCPALCQEPKHRLDWEGKAPAQRDKPQGAGEAAGKESQRNPVRWCVASSAQGLWPTEPCHPPTTPQSFHLLEEV